ncbi:MULTISPECIES: ribonuclease E inhibitor RraB [Shewanella]|jgi:regulator of RNase E activity RraB|uniref:Regulator of ribonuclease activity B n=1 Tax=Shewanella vesiculosa TaxID=518738 RepID=A0ABV0FTF3_9GAMM|nr:MULTISPECIES: ribonuclease E inhibitor RraB [Shewanella]NCQ45288.1 ribonuclease E inhibitor RraB [Shewanella frigidimarina]MBB1321018.1 ribonuclease E inhibitor RraB [Shewanella sp. SR43-8]MBB1390290.1 ribonuclease E inhibitor RraB [Shewanella sp. SG44-6]MBB1475406.1 ribonuclease E inhibitor RraB [Shewanella sp. SG41-3]NCO70724.1 ribonuclease E inhibitor RraB [Shewanella vesiculosa]|tara:strand:- start:2668 stop:3105 length:438 start_codon:yes stop_codon:yes gene_type:complete
MSVERQLKEQFAENLEIVDALLADGSEPDAEYTIEHHFSATNFDRLEKAAVDAFKLGFEVNDAEEMELEDGSIIFCFDAIAKHKLEVPLLDKACEQLIQLAAKQKVDYDGWGTYFVGDEVEGDEEDDEFEDDEYEDDNDSDDKFH